MLTSEETLVIGLACGLIMGLFSGLIIGWAIATLFWRKRL
jgi:hypothetical protein